MYEQGAFLTRAQMITNAHLECIWQMLAECNRGLVIIGSANKEGTLRNPFSARLRLEMMKEMIDEDPTIDERRLTIRTLDDMSYENDPTNLAWGEYLYSTIVGWTGTPAFAYYTGEPIAQSENWFGDRLGRLVTPRTLELDHLPSDLRASNVRRALEADDWGFLAARCPDSVLRRYEQLRMLYLKVLDDPGEDFSTMENPLG